MIVVSPWTRGGWVNSQLFDHTSIIQFLEARFAPGQPDLVESNITPWRRAVVGDLTTAFDFRTPNRSPLDLPDTAAFVPTDLVRHPDAVVVPPADPQLPEQERGIRPARAIPYRLHADGHGEPGSFSIDFRNTGAAAAVFHVRSTDPAQPPRTYTLGPGTRLADTWAAAAGHDLSVHGPNGFFRHFAGADDPRITVRARHDEPADGLAGEIALVVTNHDAARVAVTVVDLYSSRDVELTLRPGETRTLRWPLVLSRGWYDLTLALPDHVGAEYRYAGHLENGRDSVSDPGMGGLIHE
jgi:phospholipase C